MIDSEKIKIMTKLAIYDKNYGNKDKKITDYYKGDYVYKRNVSVRLGLYIGLILAGAGRFFHILMKENSIFEQIDYFTEIKSFGIISILVLVIYTVTGTFMYSKEYDLATKRMNGYYKLIDRLEEAPDTDEDWSEYL